MNKRQISVKLSEEDIALLGELGGNTKGIEELIKDYRARIKGEETKKSIEERFYDMIIMPIGPVQDTYKSLIESFIREGRQGTVEFFEHRLIGYTGFDSTTIRKHFRKMAIAHFIKASGTTFRPTIRVREGIKRDDFMLVYNAFVEFIRAKGHYRDLGEDLWG